MNKNTKRILKLAAATIVAGFLLTSCGVEKYNEPFNDAPRNKNWEGPADIIVMPDGFGNAATKCGPGGLRYTTLFHLDGAYGSVSVTPDATCAGVK